MFDRSMGVADRAKRACMSDAPISAGAGPDRADLVGEHATDVVLGGNAEGRLLFASAAIRRLLAREPLQAVESSLTALCHAEDSALWQRAVERCVESGAESRFEARLRHQDGRWIWTDVDMLPPRGAAGYCMAWVAIVRSCEDRRRAQSLLHAERLRLLSVLDAVSDGVIATAADGSIAFLNTGAERLLGWREAEVAGRPLGDVLRPAGLPVAPEPDVGAPALLAWLEPLRQRSVPLQRRDNSECMVQLAPLPVRSADGTDFGLVIGLRDSGQASVLLRELSYRASHDALTGLLNREEFERRLKQLVLDAIGTGLGHSLGYIDLDQFKLVNDTCGHAAGDALLREVSATLLGQLGENDILARLGGDEFGVLMPCRSPAEAARLAQDLVDALARMRFEWEGRQFRIGGSIGVAPIARDAGDHQTVLMAADAACYVAKERGRNRVHLFELSDVAVARRQGEMRWVPRLQTALETSDFRLLAHDILPCAGALPGEPLRMELLLALPDASGRLIPPGEFLPAAQRYGLMGRIDRWVVEQALRWLRSQESRGGRGLDMVAVNLSGSSISDPDFRAFVEDEVRAARVGPLLCFEITESEAVANLGDAAEFIGRMRALGCRFALDDFGAGLSSFPYLRRLGVDFVKIDGQFVRDMAHDPVAAALAESIHRIAKVLGLATVAEFVESAPIYAAVQRIGVDYVQGFHFGRPRPLSQVA